MEFTLSREMLIRPLQRVVGAVDKRQVTPILANILVTVKNQLLSLTGTDLEMEMIARIPLSTASESGSTTIPGKKWLEICKALPEGADISIKCQDNKVTVRSGRSRYSLSCLSAENFPRVEESAGDVELSVPQAVLRQLLDFTGFAMAQQDVRYYLNGVCMLFSSNDLRLVATDGHRLATMSLPIRTHLTQPISIILPRKAVQEMQRLFAEGEAEIGLVIGKNHLRAVTTQTSFITKLIEGKFPDYRRVFPAPNEGASMIVSREVLKQALLRVSALFSDRYRGVHLQLSSQKLRIVASTAENDQVEDEIEVAYQGPEMNIGMNSSYLIEYLNIIASPFVKGVMIGADRVMMFEAADEQGVTQGQQSYIVMPMRL